MALFINALGFQSAWWLCVAGVGHGLELPALAYGCVLMGLHLFFTPSPRRELQLTAVAVALGVVVDSVLQTAGVIDFYGWALGPLSPFWLWLLWALFAMTLNASLSFLQSQPLWLSALAGLVFGPLTYVAGAELGAAALVATPWHLGALALAWLIALPLLVHIAKQLSLSNRD